MNYSLIIAKGKQFNGLLIIKKYNLCSHEMSWGTFSQTLLLSQNLVEIWVMCKVSVYTNTLCIFCIRFGLVTLFDTHLSLKL